MSISMDAGLVVLFSIITAYLISFFQKTPTGAMGVVDFILGKHEPGMRVKSIFFGFLLPIAIGLMIGIIKSSVSPLLGCVSTGLGSFFAVSSAFFHPNLLAPPIKKKLFKARVFYILFIITYSILGFVGNFISTNIRKLVESDELQTNILYGIILAILSTFAIYGWTLFTKNKFKNTFAPPDVKSANNRHRRNSNSMRNIINFEVSRAVSEAAATAFDSARKGEENFKDSLISEMSRQVDQISHIINLTYDQQKIRNDRDFENNSLTYDSFFGIDSFIGYDVYDYGYESTLRKTNFDFSYLDSDSFEEIDTTLEEGVYRYDGVYIGKIYPNSFN